MLFLLLSVRELGCFPGRSVVFVIVRSGIGLFSRTEGATLALQEPGGRPPPVGSKCMQVGEDSFPEKDISVQVFLFLDFLFLKRETGGKLIPFHYLCRNDFCYEKDFFMPVGNGFCGGGCNGTAVGEEGSGDYGS